MTESKPMISLVTPSFNQVTLIESAISSVLDQSYPNLEYAVIDGGSTDGSADVIAKHADRLHHWVSEPDEGHYPAVNKGFASTSGEIMGYLNGDDVLLPGSLDLIAEIFSRFPKVRWLTGAHMSIDAAGRPVGVTAPRRWSRWHIITSGERRSLPQESTFWRRDLWDEAGGHLDESFPLAADYELWARFSRYAAPVSIRTPLACFRHVEGQRSIALADRYAAEVDAIQKREAGLDEANTRAAKSARRLLGYKSIRPIVDTLLGAPYELVYDPASSSFYERAHSGRPARYLLPRSEARVWEALRTTMRVAFLYHDAFAPGGYPRDMRWLAGALTDLGIEVTVLGRPGPLHDGLGSSVVVDQPASWAGALEGKPLLHAFGISNRTQFSALRALAPKASRIVFSPLAHMMREHVAVGSAMKRPAYRLAGAWLKRRDAVGHFFSAQEKKESSTYFDPDQSFVLGVGLYPDDTALEPPAPGDAYLLFFGRNDVHQKGIDLLIEGYEKARWAGLEIPLIVGGRAHGDSAAFLAAAASRPVLRGHLRVVGETDDAERSRLMSGARVFVFLSRWDGPPRPVREAIALDVVPMVTVGTNMTDDIGKHDAGLIVGAGSDDVATALLRSAEPDEIERLRANLPSLRDELAWPALAPRYARAYEEWG